MRHCLAKDTLRKLELIEYLNDKSSWLDKKDILDHFDITGKTLDKDIENINKISENNLLEISGNSIRVNFKNDENIDSAYKYILKNDLFFKILKNIFINEKSDVYELSNLFYISTSSIYRTIRANNSILKENYNIEINTNPFKLEGTEEDIRNFYFEYFIQAYGYDNWPFDDCSRELVANFLNLLMKQSGSSGDYLGYYETMVYFAVALKRIKNNNLIKNIEASNFTANIVNTQLKILDIRKILEKYEDVFGIRINFENLYQLFPAYSNARWMLSIFHAKRLRGTFSDIDKSFSRLEAIIDSLCYEFNIKAENKEELLLDLNNLSCLRNISAKNLGILKDSNKEILSNRKLIEDFSKKLFQKLDIYSEENNMEVGGAVQKRMTFSCVTKWENLYEQLYNNSLPQKVLVYSHLGPWHSKMLAKDIDFNLGRKIDYPIKFEVKNNISDLINNESDLIIVSSPIKDIQGMNTVCINSSPNENDYRKIYKALQG